MIIYLEPDDIRDIHDVMLERYNGLKGEHESGMIDFLAQKPSQEIFGQELYPDLFLKAAIYMQGFSTAQYFCDGNKRTAYGCMANFLELNGYMVILEDNELYNMSIKVANNVVTLEELAKWIGSNSTPIIYD